ncbi:MAG: hypothetical protein WDO68_04155 [Gammaproteobacteria bacterium]
MGDPITSKNVSPSSSATNVHVRIEQPQPNPGVEDSQPVLAPEVVTPPTAHTTPNNLAWLHGQLKELRNSLEEVDGSGELRDRISALALEIGALVESVNHSREPRRPDFDVHDVTDNHYVQFEADGHTVDKIYPLLTSNHGIAFGPRAVEVVNEAASLVKTRLDDLNKPDTTAKKVLRAGAKILYGLGLALSLGGAVVAGIFGLPALAVGLVVTFAFLAMGGQRHRAYHRGPQETRNDLDAANKSVEQILNSLHTAVPQTARIEKIEIVPKSAEHSSDVIVLSAQPQNAS